METDILLLPTLKRIEDSLADVQKDVAKIDTRLSVIEVKAALFGAGAGGVFSVAIVLLSKWIS